MAMSWTRRIGLALGTLLAVVLSVVGAVFGLSARELSRHYDLTPAAFTVPSDSATIERGRHLTIAIAKCTGCHGDDLGGFRMEMGPVGNFPAVNLTSGKGGFAARAASDADWVRALRHGVAADGRGLVFMPSGIYRSLSSEDLAAIIAYVKSVPPVDREVGSLNIGPIGRMLIATQTGRWIPAAGMDHAAPIPDPVPAGPDAAYGRYLTVVGGCTYCHGDDLKGGLKEGPPGTPVSADLTRTGRLGQWTASDFMAALRTGMRPDGTVIDPFMPWRSTRLMTDEEITAVWEYLRTL